MTRCVPVPGHAAVAHLSARPLTPVLGMLPTQDMQLLRCAELDSHLLVNVLGNLQPADLLQSVEGRLQAITTALPCQGVLLAGTALWVHVGGPPPSTLEVCLPGGRRSRVPYLVTRRGRLPHSDTTVINGVTCATIARAAVDIAHDCPRAWRHPSPPPADSQPLPRSGQQRLSAGTAHHRVGHIPAVNSNIISKNRPIHFLANPFMKSYRRDWCC